MNVLKAIFNCSDKQWVLDTSNLYGGDTAEIHVSVINQNYQATRELTISLEFLRGDSVLINKEYFQGRSSVVMSDDTPLIIEQHWIAAEYQHSVNLTFKADGETVSFTGHFTPPRPPQPYPSWIWEDGFWVPPVKKPINGPYTWNEGSQSWTPMFPPGSVYDLMPKYGNVAVDPVSGVQLNAINDENHKASPFGSPGIKIEIDRGNV